MSTSPSLALITVSFKGIDGVRTSIDLPRDAVADASSVRAMNTAARNGMIASEHATEFRNLADACSHNALEAGRNQMSAMRAAICGTMSPVERANALRGLLKLRVRRSF